MAAELHQEGLAYILGLLDPSDLEIGLCTDASLAEAATLASLTEVTGTGYARVTVTSLTPSAESGDDYSVVTDAVVFTATASDWDEANTMFIASISDSKLITSAPLSESRTLEAGGTLTVAGKIKLSG